MRSPSFLFGFVLAACSLHAESLWVEGEAPTQSSVQKHGWYNSVKKELLSGNEWLSHYGPNAGEASYAVAVPRAGNYTFWARLNPVASEPKWRLGKGAWTPVDFKEARGRQNIA